MGRRIKSFSIAIAAILLIIFIPLACDNNLLENLIVDVERATGNIITIKIVGNGTTNPANEIVVKKGDNTPIPISATPYTDWAFIQWQGSGVVLADANSANTTVQLTGGDTTITAVFGDTTLGVPLMINNNGHGTTDPDELQYVAFGGTTSTITVSPDTGYELTHSDWVIEAGDATVNTVVPGTSYTITVTSLLPTIALADFARIEYTLTVQDDGNLYGTTTPSGPVTVYHGIPRTITASPLSKRHGFINWTVESGTADIGNSGSASTNATLTSGAATVQANFARYGVYWTTCTSKFTVNRTSFDFSDMEQIVGSSSPCTGIDLAIVREDVYFADFSGTIWKCKLDGSGLTAIYSGSQIYAIALDLVNTPNKLYFASGTQDICRINFDGSNPETVATNGVIAARGIAVDGKGGYVYWTDINNGTVSRAYLKKNLPANPSLLIGPGLSYPYEIDLDLKNGHIYGVEATAGRCSRANLDGSDVEILIPQGVLSYPTGIDLDVDSGMMYITNQTSNTIHKYTLNGNLISLFTASGGPRNIAVVPD